MLSSKALTSAAQKIKQFECINYFQACHASISNFTLQTSANLYILILYIEHSTLIHTHVCRWYLIDHFNRHRLVPFMTTPQKIHMIRHGKRINCREFPLESHVFVFPGPCNLIVFIQTQIEVFPDGIDTLW